MTVTNRFDQVMHFADSVWNGVSKPDFVFCVLEVVLERHLEVVLLAVAVGVNLGSGKLGELVADVSAAFFPAFIQARGVDNCNRRRNIGAFELCP